MKIRVYTLPIELKGTLEPRYEDPIYVLEVDFEDGKDMFGLTIPRLRNESREKAIKRLIGSFQLSIDLLKEHKNV